MIELCLYIRFILGVLRNSTELGRSSDSLLFYVSSSTYCQLHSLARRERYRMHLNFSPFPIMNCFSIGDREKKYCLCLQSYFWQILLLTCKQSNFVFGEDMKLHSGSALACSKTITVTFLAVNVFSLLLLYLPPPPTVNQHINYSFRE